MISVCTLVGGRENHLARLVQGLEEQKQLPMELVVARMNEPAQSDLTSNMFPIRQTCLEAPYLPLAAARNAAVAAAKGSLLVFLDVDCIPGPELIRSYAAALENQSDCCVFGPVRYATAGINLDQSFDALWRGSQKHPARFDPDNEPRAFVECPGTELWGLSFALSAKMFSAIQGFDEAFEGYGGEESDFAVRAAGLGMKFVWQREAHAVHQYHPVYKPPLHHFDDIVRNAELYKRKHDTWPMTYWLDQFESQGLVERGRSLRIKRKPTQEEIAAARMPGHIAYS